MEPSRGVIGPFLHPSGFGKSWCLAAPLLEYTFGFVILSTGKTFEINIHLLDSPELTLQDNITVVGNDVL